MSAASRARLGSVVALAAGALFGVGLVISGMTLPVKVKGFLDFTGDWDPTLMFVMGGAIAVHALVYRWIRGKNAPLLSDTFRLPTKKDIEPKLLIGAAIFGLGWGLGGYCPGPAITSIVSGSVEVLAFVAAMLGAMWITGTIEKRVESKRG